MMRENGLVKLSEEAAEVIQVAQKLIQYPNLQEPLNPALDPARAALFPTKHPDGTNLRLRLQDELGDLLAAVTFVVNKLKLDGEAIENRRDMKRNLFHQWDNEK